MRESQKEIKACLEHRLGNVSFEHNIMKILSNNIHLSELYIAEIQKQLPSFQDMETINISINKVKMPDEKSLNYSIQFEPSELYSNALHHLRRITHGFVKKYCGHQKNK